ncbi:MAG: hypothetical protein DRJ15_07120 [Bacteroidetes bacterium]|nr:MAG: hypothetical protein DRJ15_07120 [Bacteroidota bacterium]
MTTGGGYAFIAFYLGFFITISLLGTYMANSDVFLSEDVPGPPTLEGPSFLDMITFAANVIAYFLLLGGLTIIGLPVWFSSSIGLVLNAILLYVLARLARGGG